MLDPVDLTEAFVAHVEMAPPPARCGLEAVSVTWVVQFAQKRPYERATSQTGAYCTESPVPGASHTMPSPA